MTITPTSNSFFSSTMTTPVKQEELIPKKTLTASDSIGDQPISPFGSSDIVYVKNSDQLLAKLDKCENSSSLNSFLQEEDVFDDNKLTSLTKVDSGIYEYDSDELYEIYTTREVLLKKITDKLISFIEIDGVISDDSFELLKTISAYTSSKSNDKYEMFDNSLLANVTDEKLRTQIGEKLYEKFNEEINQCSSQTRQDLFLRKNIDTLRYLKASDLSNLLSFAKNRNVILSQLFSKTGVFINESYLVELLEKETAEGNKVMHLWNIIINEKEPIESALSELPDDFFSSNDGESLLSLFLGGKEIYQKNMLRGNLKYFDNFNNSRQFLSKVLIKGANFCSKTITHLLTDRPDLFRKGYIYDTVADLSNYENDQELMSSIVDNEKGINFSNLAQHISLYIDKPNPKGSDLLIQLYSDFLQESVSKEDSNKLFYNNIMDGYGFNETDKTLLWGYGIRHPQKYMPETLTQTINIIKMSFLLLLKPEDSNDIYFSEISSENMDWFNNYLNENYDNIISRIDQNSEDYEISLSNFSESWNEKKALYVDSNIIEILFGKIVPNIYSFEAKAMGYEAISSSKMDTAYADVNNYNTLIVEDSDDELDKQSLAILDVVVDLFGKNIDLINFNAHGAVDGIPSFKNFELLGKLVEGSSVKQLVINSCYIGALDIDNPQNFAVKVSKYFPGIKVSAAEDEESPKVMFLNQDNDALGFIYRGFRLRKNEVLVTASFLTNPEGITEKTKYPF